MQRVEGATYVKSDCAPALALALARQLLSPGGPGPLSDDSFLLELALAFHAEGAGWVEADGRTARRRLTAGEPDPPWSADAALLIHALDRAVPLVLSHARHDYLCAASGPDRLLWVERTSPADWSAEEEASLHLVAMALERRSGSGGAAPTCPGQQRLEDTVLVARRLAHVYSNVLTSVLGFVEMSLTQVPAHSTLKRYLDVAFRGAQQGVQLTQRLRLLGCKATAASQGASLLPALARQLGRRTTSEKKVEEVLDVPGELPAVALSSEQVVALLDALLDNAHEAIEQAGRVTVSARVVTPSPDEVRQTWGRMTPGAYARLDVSDTGVGLGPEARHRLFRQPFFTLKPRHHGLGLTIVHSIVSSQQGGVCLLDNPEGGVTARVYLPVLAPAGVPGPSDRRDQR
jgi:signal transduction histidine kinase